jgi:hypothetical protein
LHFADGSVVTQAEDSLGVNIRSIVIVAVMMMLMMFAVHCTWVTSNAYSSPSIVLASYRPDGSGPYTYCHLNSAFSLF